MRWTILWAILAICNGQIYADDLQNPENWQPKLRAYIEKDIKLAGPIEINPFKKKVIILIGTTGLLVSMHPSVPIKTIKQVIAYAKANPNKLNIGSAGTGGLGHLAGELFKLQTGVVFTHVPYKGSGPVMTALLSGEVDSSFSSLVPSIPHVKAGRLRAIAVTTPKRSRALPDVPTIGETVPGYDVTHWYGMWGPKGIPKEIVTRWNQEVAKVLNTDAMKKWLAQEGLEPAGGPPEEFLNRIRSDVDKWKKVVKAANIRLAN